MPDDLPSIPREAYQRIIDQLVDRTPGVTAKRIIAGDSLADADPDTGAAFTEFAASLSQSQREVLAQLCIAQRHGAIHDTLAALSWWIDCGGVSLRYNDSDMPVDISGMGLHGDYVGRGQGWDWPDDD